MKNKAQQIIEEIKKVVSGKDDVVQKLVCAIIAGGNILIEDVPGVGKTTLALAASKALGLEFRRVQFTPDTVASDITGYTAFDKSAGKFVFHQGAAMTNILLADEINRTSGKTQAALLEVMEEHSCTVDGVTYGVPTPFYAIATQNPTGSAGTFKLPNSQLDRFMIKLKMGYPDRESMKKILRDRHHSNPIDSVKSVCSKDELITLMEECNNVFVDEKIYDYIAELCEMCRKCDDISIGISPRGALALCKMAKATAYCSGRNYVTAADIRKIFTDVCAHRIVLSSKAIVAEKSQISVLDELIKQVKEPEMTGVR